MTRADLVVGAALIPGAAAPKLVSREMVAAMKPGKTLGSIHRGWYYFGGPPVLYHLHGYALAQGASFDWTGFYAGQLPIRQRPGLPVPAIARLSVYESVRNRLPDSACRSLPLRTPENSYMGQMA